MYKSPLPIRTWLDLPQQKKKREKWLVEKADPIKGRAITSSYPELGAIFLNKSEHKSN